MCGIVVHVDGDRVVRVTGDPDHPVSEGYTCPKGRSLPAVHHDPARLADPHWERTLDELADRLEALIALHGAGAIGGYRATHWAFDATGRMVAERFFRALPTAQLYSAVTVDAPNKTLVPDLVAGAPFLFPVPDWEAARLLLLVGQNPVVSHGHSVARPNALVALRRLRARGGRVIVADPRATETARGADLHLPVRPGSDPALLAGLIRAVFAAGVADTEFLARCADAPSVDRLRALVEPYTTDAVAGRCGLDRATVEATIDLLLSAGRVAVQTGTGISMGAAPNVGEWLGWALGAVTGSLDRPGGVLFNPGVLRPQEERLVARPRHSGPGPGSRPDLSAAYGELPCTALADEIDAGALRALFVLGGNPLTTLPGSERLRRSFATLDVLAVCDIRASETTAAATHVLPVAGQLERGDLTSFLDLAFPFPFAQYSPAAVDAGPGRPPMWRVFAGLGRRLGLPGFAELERETDESLLAASAARARLPWAELAAAPSGVAPTGTPGPGWLIPDRLPAGRLDLAPAEMAVQLHGWASAPVEQGLVLINRRELRQTNSMLRHGARPPALLMHPDDAARLSLSSGQPVRISTADGSTVATVGVTGAIRPGAVSLPHGWSAPAVNALTSAATDVEPLTGMPRLSGIAVEVAADRSPAILRNPCGESRSERSSQPTPSGG
jgi:anaerobic selenocysteine-containing dehydrogenase